MDPRIKLIEANRHRLQFRIERAPGGAVITSHHGYVRSFDGELPPSTAWPDWFAVRSGRVVLTKEGARAFGFLPEGTH